jgi:DNA-directed RNA polymerase subunit RPC12/RpoP
MIDGYDCNGCGRRFPEPAAYRAPTTGAAWCKQCGDGQGAAQQRVQEKRAIRATASKIETLERERADIMALKCNTCGRTFGLHHWGHHGPGPFDGLVCPTPEAQEKLAAFDADRYGLR